MEELDDGRRSSPAKLWSSALARLVSPRADLPATFLHRVRARMDGIEKSDEAVTMARGERVGDAGAWDCRVSRVDRGFDSRLTRLRGLRVREDGKGAGDAIAIATESESDAFAERYRVVSTNVARVAARRAPALAMPSLHNPPLDQTFRSIVPRQAPVSLLWDSINSLKRSRSFSIRRLTIPRASAAFSTIPSGSYSICSMIRVCRSLRG
jgi:hypothetical protein